MLVIIITINHMLYIGL